MSKKYVNILIVAEGDTAAPRRWRFPMWLYRTALVFAVVVVIAPILYVALNFEVVARAANASKLAEENESLRRNQTKLQALEQSLFETRQLVSQISAMAGLDSTMLAGLYVGIDTDPASGGEGNPRSASRLSPASSPIPEGLPSAGWVSQGFSEASGKMHSGIDLVVPEGTDVLSTAFGTVTFAGQDSVYGNMVVVRHNDSVETIYGHNRELLVQVGDTIFAGQRIALSGNTGISSAPHLHYELRVHGKAVNPLTSFIYENQNKYQ